MLTYRGMLETLSAHGIEEIGRDEHDQACRVLGRNRMGFGSFPYTTVFAESDLSPILPQVVSEVLEVFGIADPRLNGRDSP